MQIVYLIYTRCQQLNSRDSGVTKNDHKTVYAGFNISPIINSNITTVKRSWPASCSTLATYHTCCQRNG